MKEGITDSEGEGEDRAVTSQVARAPKGSLRSNAKPQDSPTPAEPSASSLTDLSPPESISGDEDSNGENVFDSLTSHTTATSSTSADMLSAEASGNMPHIITESQFSAVMPYMENSGQTSSNVFLETSATDPHTSQQIPQSLDTSEASSPIGTPPQSLAPRRSARSTKGAPLHVLGRLLPMVQGLPTCMTNLYTDRLYLFQAYQI